MTNDYQSETNNCEDCQLHIADYADQNLSELLQTKIETHLQTCDSCQAQLEQIWQLESMAMRYQEEAVPSWSRREHFFESRSWFANFQLVSSFASLAIIVLFVSQANINTENGFKISFGNDNYLTQAALNTRITELETELSQKQKNHLQVRLDNLSDQQVATTQLLLRTVLQQSREERRDELDTLATAWDQMQHQREKQTNESLHALLVNQVEDKRNIEQLNKLLSQAAYKGAEL